MLTSESEIKKEKELPIMTKDTKPKRESRLFGKFFPLPEKTYYLRRGTSKKRKLKQKVGFQKKRKKIVNGLQLDVSSKTNSPRRQKKKKSVANGHFGTPAKTVPQRAAHFTQSLNYPSQGTQKGKDVRQNCSKKKEKHPCTVETCKTTCYPPSQDPCAHNVCRPSISNLEKELADFKKVAAALTPIASNSPQVLQPSVSSLPGPSTEDGPQTCGVYMTYWDPSRHGTYAHNTHKQSKHSLDNDLANFKPVADSVPSPAAIPPQVLEPAVSSLPGPSAEDGPLICGVFETHWPPLHPDTVADKIYKQSIDSHEKEKELTNSKEIDAPMPTLAPISSQCPPQDFKSTLSSLPGPSAEDASLNLKPLNENLVGGTKETETATEIPEDSKEWFKNFDLGAQCFDVVKIEAPEIDVEDYLQPYTNIKEEVQEISDNQQEGTKAGCNDSNYPFACEICGMSYKSSTGLSIHYKVLHNSKSIVIKEEPVPKQSTVSPGTKSTLRSQRDSHEKSPPTQRRYPLKKKPPVIQKKDSNKKNSALNQQKDFNKKKSATKRQKGIIKKRKALKRGVIRRTSSRLQELKLKEEAAAAALPSPSPKKLDTKRKISTSVPEKLQENTQQAADQVKLDTKRKASISASEKIRENAQQDADQIKLDTKRKASISASEKIRENAQQAADQIKKDQEKKGMTTTFDYDHNYCLVGSERKVMVYGCDICGARCKSSKNLSRHYIVFHKRYYEKGFKEESSPKQQKDSHKGALENQSDSYETELTPIQLPLQQKDKGLILKQQMAILKQQMAIRRTSIKFQFKPIKAQVASALSPPCPEKASPQSCFPCEICFAPFKSHQALAYHYVLGYCDRHEDSESTDSAEESVIHTAPKQDASDLPSSAPIPPSLKIIHKKSEDLTKDKMFYACATCGAPSKVPNGQYCGHNKALHKCDSTVNTPTESTSHTPPEQVVTTPPPSSPIPPPCLPEVVQPPISALPISSAEDVSLKEHQSSNDDSTDGTQDAETAKKSANSTDKFENCDNKTNDSDMAKIQDPGTGVDDSLNSSPLEKKKPRKKKDIQQDTSFTPYTCKICGAPYVTANGLYNHFKAFHKSELDSVASPCSPEFSQPTLSSSLPIPSAEDGSQKNPQPPLDEDSKGGTQNTKTDVNTRKEDSGQSENKDDCDNTKIPIHIGGESFLPHVCGLCGCRFKSAFGVDSHYETFHKRRFITAGTPEKSADYTPSKQADAASPPPAPCAPSPCPPKISNQTVFAIEDDHLNIPVPFAVPMPKGPKKWSCPVCWYSSFRKSDITRHLTKHTGEKPYKCSRCQKGFTQVSSLRKHRFTCLAKKVFENRISDIPVPFAKPMPKGPKKWACPVCWYSSLRKSDIIRHLTKHTGEKPYKCSKCEKHFTEASGLRKHRFKCLDKEEFENMTSDKQLNDNSVGCTQDATTAGKVSEDFKDQCDDFDEEREDFKRSRQQKDVRKGYWDNLKAIMRNKPDTYVCDICGAPYVSSYSLYLHYKQHTSKRANFNLFYKFKSTLSVSTATEESAECNNSKTSTDHRLSLPILPPPSHRISQPARSIEGPLRKHQSLNENSVFQSQDPHMKGSGQNKCCNSEKELSMDKTLSIPYACEICGVRSFAIQSMDYHYERVHSGDSTILPKKSVAHYISPQHFAAALLPSVFFNSPGPVKVLQQTCSSLPIPPTEDGYQEKHQSLNKISLDVSLDSAAAEKVSEDSENQFEDFDSATEQLDMAEDNLLLKRKKRKAHQKYCFEPDYFDHNYCSKKIHLCETCGSRFRTSLYLSLHNKKYHISESTNSNEEKSALKKQKVNKRASGRLKFKERTQMVNRRTSSRLQQLKLKEQTQTTAALSSPCSKNVLLPSIAPSASSSAEGDPPSCKIELEYKGKLYQPVVMLSRIDKLLECKAV